MKFRFLALLLAAVPAVHATTLVAVWTPERVVLGADSLVSTEAAAQFGCKISRSGTTYFALSGLVEDVSTGYNLNALTLKALARSGGIDSKLSSFVGTVRPLLAKAIAAIRRDAPSDYALLASGKPVIQAIFAEQNSPSPVLAVASFRLDPAGELREYTSVVASADDRLGPRIIYAGQQTRIREYLREHRDWYAGDTVQLTRSLIELEIGARTGHVGGPVDIVALGPEHAEWLQKKSSCAE